jgi:hypothetical protein
VPPGVANQSPRRRETAGEQASPGRLAAFLDEHRAGLGAILVAIAAVGLGWAGWSRFGDRVRGAADLMLHPDSITVEGIAPWVRADLKSEALRDASLDAGIPLDDPELVRRLARAFAMHPWVREVVSVTATHPAAADVVVRCREPVAMVAVPGGLLAVDAEAVVLPSDDFTAETAAEYPRITGVPSGPQGAVGFPWGDPLVEEGWRRPWGRIGNRWGSPAADRPAEHRSHRARGNSSTTRAARSFLAPRPATRRLASPRRRRRSHG